MGGKANFLTTPHAKIFSEARIDFGNFRARFGMVTGVDFGGPSHYWA